MKEILFGAAYYDEYMPYDRLDKDIDMMKKAGINTVRIAESTWSTCEPQDGVFDFSHVERVMDAMEEAGINVIIGRYVRSACVDGESSPGCDRYNEKRRRDLWCKTDHGHYQSGISFLCGACDPQADGDQCPQEMCYRFPGG